MVILVKTIAQAVTTPQLVGDSENPYGRTVHNLIDCLTADVLRS